MMVIMSRYGANWSRYDANQAKEMMVIMSRYGANWSRYDAN